MIKEQLAEYILPGLVQRALNGSESAKAAILHGLLDACHKPSAEGDKRPGLVPLLVLNDYKLGALRTSANSVYTETALYECLFCYESFRILKFVIEDYKQSRGCSGRCSECGLDLDVDVCRASGAASWESFLPIFELQNPLIDTNPDLWLEQHSVDEQYKEKEQKVLGIILNRIEGLLNERNQKILQRSQDTRYYNSFSNTFSDIKELVCKALATQKDEKLFFEDAFADENNCLHPDVYEKLNELISIQVVHQDIDWGEHLEPVERAMKIGNEILPLPAHIVIKRIFEFFKE